MPSSPFPAMVFVEIMLFSELSRRYMPSLLFVMVFPVMVLPEEEDTRVMPLPGLF